MLRCLLNLPAQIAGIAVDREPLQLTIFSIYPMDLSWNGQAIFEDAGVPVAAGPALVQVIPSLRAGDNGELEAHIHVPNNQTTPWFHLRFTTPGLRARFELLDVAWAQLALAHDLAVSAAERAMVAVRRCVRARAAGDQRRAGAAGRVGADGDRARAICGARQRPERARDWPQPHRHELALDLARHG